MCEADQDANGGAREGASGCSANGMRSGSIAVRTVLAVTGSAGRSGRVAAASSGIPARSGLVDAGRSSARRIHPPEAVKLLLDAGATSRGELPHRSQPSCVLRAAFDRPPCEVIAQAVRHGAPLRQRQDTPDALAIMVRVSVKNQANVRLYRITCIVL